MWNNNIHTLESTPIPPFLPIWSTSVHKNVVCSKRVRKRSVTDGTIFCLHSTNDTLSSIRVPFPAVSLLPFIWTCPSHMSYSHIS